jgi:hypothetical protein
MIPIELVEVKGERACDLAMEGSVRGAKDEITELSNSLRLANSVVERAFFNDE